MIPVLLADSPGVQVVSLVTYMASHSCQAPQRSWRQSWCAGSAPPPGRPLHAPPPQCCKTHKTWLIYLGAVILSGFLILSSLSLWLIVDTSLPVFEGIVDYSLQQQSVSNLRRSPEGEHVYGPQGRVSLTQTAAQRKRYYWIKKINTKGYFRDPVDNLVDTCL